MEIWHLNPVDLEDAAWESSTYKGPVVVRAESEEEARQIATQSFIVATEVRTGARTVLCPWKDPALVSAVARSESPYERDGVMEIPGPPRALEFATG